MKNMRLNQPDLDLNENEFLLSSYTYICFVCLDCDLDCDKISTIRLTIFKFQKLSCYMRQGYFKPNIIFSYRCYHPKRKADQFGAIQKVCHLKNEIFDPLPSCDTCDM